MKNFFLITIITVVLCSCSSVTVEAVPTVFSTATDFPMITPTDLPPTLTATVEATKVSELPRCPTVGGAGSSWKRYKPNSLEDVITEANQVSSREKNPGISFYIETSGEHQIPSCIMVEYSGAFREISEERKFLIEAWSGVFDSERKQLITEILKHEVLLIENGQGYWIPVQEPLIPYMKNELTENKSAIVFIIWIGSSYLSEETDHAFVIGEFAKP